MRYFAVINCRRLTINLFSTLPQVANAIEEYEVSEGETAKFGSNWDDTQQMEEILLTAEHLAVPLDVWPNQTASHLAFFLTFNIILLLSLGFRFLIDAIVSRHENKNMFVVWTTDRAEDSLRFCQQLTGWWSWRGDPESIFVWWDLLNLFGFSVTPLIERNRFYSVNDTRITFSKSKERIETQSCVDSSSFKQTNVTVECVSSFL